MKEKQATCTVVEVAEKVRSCKAGILHGAKSWGATLLPSLSMTRGLRPGLPHEGGDGGRRVTRQRKVSQRMAVVDEGTRKQVRQRRPTTDAVSL